MPQADASRSPPTPVAPPPAPAAPAPPVTALELPQPNRRTDHNQQHHELRRIGGSPRAQANYLGAELASYRKRGAIRVHRANIAESKRTTVC